MFQKNHRGSIWHHIKLVKTMNMSLYYQNNSSFLKLSVCVFENAVKYEMCFKLCQAFLFYPTYTIFFFEYLFLVFIIFVAGQ